MSTYTPNHGDLALVQDKDFPAANGPQLARFYGAGFASQARWEYIGTGFTTPPEGAVVIQRFRLEPIAMDDPRCDCTPSPVPHKPYCRHWRMEAAPA